MTARRLPLGLLAPLSLLVLVIALGALQYRWVGQVSEADRAQLRQSLDRRAREFADDFDREIGRAYHLFRPDPGFSPDAPERFANQYDEWLTAATFPTMVKTAYYASGDGRDVRLYRYLPESRSFEVVDWPESLQAVRTRLTGPTPSPLASLPSAASVVFSASGVMPDVPALIIPESQTPPIEDVQGKRTTPGQRTATMDVTVTLRSGRPHTVLELDRNVLASMVLPTLAERHFPESGADRFRMSVVDGKSRSVMSRGATPEHPIDPSTADATASFFNVRMETVRITAAATPTGRSSPAPASWSEVVPDRPRTAEAQQITVFEQHVASVGTLRVGGGSTWTVLLQHAAGSLDAAVARARRRNLWLSFGILGVLAASAGLVVVNARRSERLAASQMDFVATVSHELRTPLAVIRSAAQNLSAGVVQAPDQARRYGELIESEGRRLTDMVEQVLEYAGLSGHRRPPAARIVDAARLVANAVSAASALPEAGQSDFDVQLDDHVPAVAVDAEAMRRAVLNLISNALKHAGGRWVGVTVKRGSGPDDRYVLVSVADRGPGIAPADLPHVFEPFYRGQAALDGQIQGNGLGLSLVKRIVEAHGGRVSVVSAPGEGSTFTLHVPIAPGATVAADDEPADPAEETAMDSSSPHPASGRSV